MCVEDGFSQIQSHMYFPCPEILHFLIAVDISTKENVNVAGFKEHGAELLHIVSSTLQKVDHHRALFVDLLVIEVPYSKKFWR